MVHSSPGGAAIVLRATPDLLPAEAAVESYHLNICTIVPVS
jgi:hypothetical protein